jgi:hypothetical protein
MHKEDGMRKGIIVMVTLTILVTGTKSLYAYTYMYHNKTGYLIRVIVEVYQGEDRINLIESNEFHSFVTDLLLKSWRAEAFLDNRWKQILHLTCDFLPGNHSFSIYVNETMDPHGTVTRDWYSAGH